MQIIARIANVARKKKRTSMDEPEGTAAVAAQRLYQEQDMERRSCASEHHNKEERCESGSACQSADGSAACAAERLRTAGRADGTAYNGNAAGSGGAQAADSAGAGGFDSRGSAQDGDEPAAAIKSRYCRRADETLRSLFDDDGSCLFDSEYVEVPRDQYEEIVAQLREKVKLGKVKTASGKTIKNPDTILKKIKKGSLSYKQASNIARAGNIDSLRFDLKTNAVSCSCSLGVSFAVSMALSIWNGQNIKEALSSNLRSSINGSISSLFISVATAQVLRTSASQLGAQTTTNVLNYLYSSSAGRHLIDSTAMYSAGSALTSSAAVAQVSSLLRTNVISGAVTTVILTAPDFYRALFRRSISWQQLTKNLAVNAASVAAGTASWFIGASTGAAVGSAIPIVGTAIGGMAGGLIGACAGGSIGAKYARKAADKVRQDDSQLMLELCMDIGSALCEDYMLTEKEAGKLIDEMRKSIDQKWLTSLYASGRTNEARFKWGYEHFENIAFAIARSRSNVVLPDNARLTMMAGDLIQQELLALPAPAPSAGT